jgi:hypothetical protein
MKTIADRFRQSPFLRAGLWMTVAILAALACKFPLPATPTPVPATVPAGWTCYQNATYGFEVCYPPDATLTTSTPEHARISMPVAPGTNLAEKWMDIDAGTGWATCESPQAEGYTNPADLHPEHHTINGLDFLVQSGSQGAAGNFYDWTGYSTERAGVCASLSGVVHTLNALNFPTPPPTVDPTTESTVFGEIAATFRWLDATPTPVATATVPAGWVCYTNATYAFEFCYPADATLSDETTDHVRVHLTIAAGTNLLEKWMDADGRTIPPSCESPQAEGYDPSAITSSTQTIAGLSFLVQSASEGAAGNIYQWTGYSTERDTVCASLTGVLHSAQPGNYSTPPPLFDEAAESAVFEQIVATFHWLEVGTPTPTAAGGDQPTATFQENTYCLRGPHKDLEAITYIKKGVSLIIEGRNQDGTWFWVRPPGSNLHCWVWSGLVKTSGDPDKAQVIEVPLGCWVYQPGSFTTGKASGKTVCIAPCPAGAKPGGVCLP